MNNSSDIDNDYTVRRDANFQDGSFQAVHLQHYSTTVKANKVISPRAKQAVREPEPPPLFPVEIAFLHARGYSESILRSAVEKAKKLGVAPHHLLISIGVIPATAYYRYLAEDLGIPFLEAGKIKPARKTAPGPLLQVLRGKPLVLHQPRYGLKRLVCAPEPEDIKTLKKRFQFSPELRDHFAISTPDVVRAAMIEKARPALHHHASWALYNHMPRFSAYRTSFIGLMMIAALLAVFFSVFVLWPVASVSFAVQIALALLFLAAILLRLASAALLETNKNRINKRPIAHRGTVKNIPVYTVLVALYDEANLVPELVNHLSALNWPVDRLDIKIILEDNDTETLNAVKTAILKHRQFEIHIVPQGEPRTKPRALNYALALARGEYVVIYDAEDRPHPDQLHAAYTRFQNLPAEIACLQAPILTDNYRDSWLSAMFRLEYASQFDGLMPLISRLKMPMMLGGTSNHFRASVLRKVGAWDPHNVTEDADLGIRLFRFGYHSDVLDHPTFEEAPVNWGVWLRQRTRWFKGWMQTCIVHMRNPVAALREFGLHGFLSYHLLSTTLLISCLAHPAFVVLVAVEILRTGDSSALPTFFLQIATLELLVAYFTFGYLAARTMAYRGHVTPFWIYLTIPFYWVLLTVAAWRAFFQLLRAPHLWEKTPHGQIARKQPPWVSSDA